MLDKFQLKQPFEAFGCLSSVKALEQGQQVWHVVQHHHHYVLKWLDARADENSHRAHQNECVIYKNLSGHGFCCEADIVDQDHANAIVFEDRESKDSEVHFHQIKSTEIKSDVLILEFVETLSHTHFDLYTVQEKHALLIKMVKALKAFHDRGYVHADLKIEHISLSLDQIKLLDFGQSRYLGDVQSYSSITATPAYMAPEMFRGEEPSIQSDLYALGIIFYSILTGQKPFIAQTYHAWAIAHCQTPVPLMSEEMNKYQNMIDLMLAKQKTNRLQDLNMLLNVLDLIK